MTQYGSENNNELEVFRDLAKDIYEDVEQTMTTDESMVDSSDLLKQIIMQATLAEHQLEHTMVVTESDIMEKLMLRGIFMLCICVIQEDEGDIDCLASLQRFEAIMESGRQHQECIWLYTYCMYLHGEFHVNYLDGPQIALTKFIEALKNIQEYKIFDDRPPFEVNDILEVQNPVVTIFSSFEGLHEDLLLKILTCATRTLDKDALFEHGIAGIQFALKGNCHPSQRSFNDFLESIACVTEVFIERFYFKQARQLIRFCQYMIEMYWENEISAALDQIHNIYRKLFVTYAYKYMNAVARYRKFNETPDNQALQKVFQSNGMLLLGTQLPTALDVDDSCINNLIFLARKVSCRISGTDDNEEIDKFEKDLETGFIASSDEKFQDQIKTTKIMFECIATDQYAFANDHQKFTWLTKMLDEARCLLENIGDEHALYEEMAGATCALGLIFIKEYASDHRYSHKAHSVLDYCEMLAESLRLLPSGLILFMLSKFFQATNKINTKDFKTALKDLNAARAAYEEYSLTVDEAPKNLLQLLQVQPHGIPMWKQFKPITTHILIHKIKYTTLKVTLELHHDELIQQKGLHYLKSAFVLYNHQNTFTICMLMEVLISLAYEFLERGHLAQVNHLIICANHTVIMCPDPHPKENAALDILRLCYYHTLICQSLSLVEHNNIYKFLTMEQKYIEDFFLVRILEETDVIADEQSYPMKPNNDIDEIGNYFSDIGKLLEKLVRRRDLEMADVELIGLIKGHLEKLHATLKQLTEEVLPESEPENE